MLQLRIKDILRDKGIAQKELADTLGIGRVALSRILNGNPTIGTLEKIANALDVPISALFEDSNDKNAFVALVVNKGCTHSFTDKKEFKDFAMKLEI